MTDFWMGFALGVICTLVLMGVTFGWVALLSRADSTPDDDEEW